MKELTPDLYYLFRKGMELRPKHVMEIFGTDELHLKYPNLINKSHHPVFSCTAYLYDMLSTPIKYDITRFVEKAPDIYNNGYKSNTRLHVGLLEILTPVDGKSQIYHGFMSGFLKYDRSNGFYFDEKGSAVLDQYIEEEH